MTAQPTRRAFLGVAGSLLASSVGTAADAEPVRVAVVGTGARGSDLIRALRLRLENLELPGPAESVALDLAGLTAETGIQERLPGYRTRWTTPLIEATRHLKQRYGDSPLFQIIEVEPWSRIPERRHALLSYEP